MAKTTWNILLRPKTIKKMKNSDLLGAISCHTLSHTELFIYFFVPPM